MRYRQLNNISGWLVAAVAFTVYLLTMERTVSFWDCGEFLACAYKLEVGHAPGAPFFMLMQRMAALLAGPDAWTGKPSADAVLFMNGLSALTSALTILFLFWTISHMARKLVIARDEEPSGGQVMLILGSAVVGALAYTFSDTFWFSAVEAEVYATSSFFTALVFWAMLKWEDHADRPHADRWLVFISLLVGISIGVHLLNLLTIPALAMIWYFSKYKPTRKGMIITFITGCGILGFVQFGVIQVLPILASKFDLFFVNSLGLPFDSGALCFMLLLSGGLVWALITARRKANYLLHTGLLCLVFVVLGCFSYLVPLIRARAHVPVNMTNPDNTLSLVSYLQRDQYLQQPLLYGQDYNSRMTGLEHKGDKYSQVQLNGKDHYEATDKKLEYKYDAADLRFFPRIWDVTDPAHARFYKAYLGLGEEERPTASDNFSYFLGYQVDWLWWRYFMWNYAGRQNDFQGQGDAKNSNWLAGIGLLDRQRTGDVDGMHPGYASNKARNELYCLPLVLGVLGMVFQFNRNRRDGLVTLMLFFFTGLAIAIYLNMYPMQPRERDYAFAGSTYAFAIWIGLGVLMINRWLARMMKNNLGPALAVLLCLLCVPVLMAREEWDDHDRSHKSLAWASAMNTLQSCAPNAILFTSGDNDTYPLWYLQEVEGVRTDVRVIITELAGTDWFIDQLQRKANNAAPVPMVWKREAWLGGRHNYVGYYPDPKLPQDKYYNLYEICQFMAQDDPRYKVALNSGERENYLPSKNFFVESLSKEELISRGLLDPKDSGNITNEMKFSLTGNGVYKNDQVIMNIIATVARDGWKRPIYFNGSFPGNNDPIGVGEYLQQEGVVYRLLPYRLNDANRAAAREPGWVNLDKTYKLFMQDYHWGGAERKDVYFDEKNRVMLIAYRLYAARTADALTQAGRKEDAVQLLDKVMTHITEEAYYYDFTSYYIAMAYYNAGATANGKDLALKLGRNATADLKWIRSLDEEKQEAFASDVRNDLSILNTLAAVAGSAGDQATAKELQQQFEAMAPSGSPQGGGM